MSESIGFLSCLQLFPVPDMEKTSRFYQRLGFKSVPYLQASDPHICLYRDKIEIVLIGSQLKSIQPNYLLHGYGYDAYFICDNQEDFYKECLESEVTIILPLSRTDDHNREFVFEDMDGRRIAVGKKIIPSLSE
ncbi:VOC family protein [Bacillus sp. 1P06AnD]|uniref:VOC family protein n=1 Tax=Bacillus sp. 1P06AnD TaxID=3132208 RepID=UPI0039A29137